MNSSVKYRPEIDGLRALAVIPVIFFHLGFNWIQGGFAGVDVFFVISGYLISLIILREEEHGNFSLKAFWARRARRILPALSSVILVCIIAGYWILFRFDWKNLGAQGLSVFGLISNFKMWKLASNYWAPATHETPLLHTWSLAVEEQFYLFYPLLLIIILKFAKQHAFKLLWVGTIISFFIGYLATSYYPAAAFYLLPSRAWELGAGCLLAMVTHKHKKSFGHTRFASILSIFGILTIIISYLLISEERGFPGYQAIFPVIGSILVIAFTSRGQIMGKTLASAPVCYLGKISYSLYLWHWPVIVYGHIIKQQSQFVVPLYITLGLILLLSVGSYHLIEKPARFSKKWPIPVCLLSIISISASAAMFFWKIQYDTSSFSPLVWKGRLYDTTPTQKPWDGFMHKRMTGIEAPMREEVQSNDFAELGIFKAYGTSDPEIVVLGDSHALMWSSTIDEICSELGLSVSFFTADGTPPWIELPLEKKATEFFSAEEKLQYDKARIRILTEKNPKLVILACKYSVMDDVRKIQSLLDLTSKSKAKCLIIEQPPILPFGDKNALIYCSELHRKNTQQTPISYWLPIGEYENWIYCNAMINRVAESRSNTSVLKISDLYHNSNNQIQLSNKNTIYYIDDDHLSEDGAKKGKSRIKNKIIHLIRHQ